MSVLAQMSKKNAAPVAAPAQNIVPISQTINANTINLGRPHTPLVLDASMTAAIKAAKENLEKIKNPALPPGAVAQPPVKTTANARRAAVRPVTGLTKSTRTSIAEGMGKRNDNLAEKNAASAAVVKCLAKDPNYEVFMLECLLQYGKVFSLSLSTNEVIVENAVTKAKSVGYDAGFFIQRYECYLTDYENFIGAFLTDCVAEGANEKFLSWGLFAENFKDDLYTAFDSMLGSGYESLKFLYNKWTFYSLSIEDAIHFNKKFLNATIMPLVTLRTQFPNKPLDLAVKDNDEAMKHWANFGKFETQVASDFRGELNKLDFHMAAVSDFNSSLLIASGVSPYGILQCSAYKQGMNTPAVTKPVYIAVADQFNLILNAYNYVFGQKLTFAAAGGYKFPQLQAFIFKLYRPLFIYSRTLRMIIFPQSNIQNNSQMDLTHYFTDKSLANIDFAKMFADKEQYKVVNPNAPVAVPAKSPGKQGKK